jgi:hypothetical protein
MLNARLKNKTNSKLGNLLTGVILSTFSSSQVNSGQHIKHTQILMRHGRHIKHIQILKRHGRQKNTGSKALIFDFSIYLYHLFY